ncbi:uncharacterized protein PRCAT00003689001 [Priceomyces carsonii]|uniref:uncharacterized protein n=1 Tax=Priceomyces carsonii TaxID=28549 RepID=UPI002ED97F52|nr:unnamed protein product [Priceomyces carsonii]
MSSSSVASSGSIRSDLSRFLDPRPYTGNDASEKDNTEPKPANYFKQENKSWNSDIAEDATPKESFFRKFLKNLRPGYVIDHLDYPSFKIIFRTWVQLWVSVILGVIPKTSHWMGSAAYLLQIIGFVAVSGGSLVIMSVVSGVIYMFYICIAWIHAILAMKISNKLRGSITPQQLSEMLIQEGTCTIDNISTCMSEQIFTGRFLETRCTVIFIFALMFGITLLGLTSSYHPFFKIGFILGSITLVINICYGVFFPIFEPLSIGFSVIRPMGIGLSLRVLFCIFIFPSTSNHSFFQGASKIVQAVKQISEKNTDFIRTLNPSSPDFINYKDLKKDIIPLSRRMVALDIFASTARYEVSYGRFDLGDAAEFRSAFKNVVGSLASFSYFYQLLHERRDMVTHKYESISRRGSLVSNGNRKVNGSSKLFTTIQESYKEVGKYENRKRIELLKRKISNQNPDSLSADDLVDISKFISEHFSSMFEATTEALGVVIEWMGAANEFRILTLINPRSRERAITRQKECNEKVILAKQKIHDQLTFLRDQKKSEKLLKDASRSEESLLALISQTSLVIHLLESHCRQLQRILDLFLSIDETRPVPKFITYFTRSKRDFTHTLHLNLDEEFPLYLESEIQRRDPDALPPSSIFHLLGIKFVKLYKIILHRHLWFWIRTAGCSVIAATPYFCRTTAHWYYSNRLIWLVIMTTISTSENTGESVYVFIAKLFYTFFGCLLGMVCWYISTGSGNGNYYGYCAVTAVVYLYLCYYRHFSVHLSPMPAVLYAVTSALVLGTSWVDAKHIYLANIGAGFEVAYTRFISVIIGLTIGLIPTLFPKPHTSKAEIRFILSRTVEEVGNLHCSVSKFAFERIENPLLHILNRHDFILEKFRYVQYKLSSISKLMIALYSEIPITGVWPEAKYKKLQELILDIIQLYFIAYSALDKVKSTSNWIPIILRRMGWTESDLNADIFAVLHMTSHVLKNADELPKITEANISLKHLEILRRQWGRKNLSLNERFYIKDHDDDSAAELMIDEDDNNKDELHESIKVNLDFKKFLSKDGILDVVLLLVSHLLYERLDEMMLAVKSLVGEKYDFNTDILEDYSDTDNLL